MDFVQRDILKSLVAGKKYSFRLVATNVGGTSKGAVHKFTTLK